MEHESDGDTNCNWCTRYSHQRIGKGTGGLGNKRTNGDLTLHRVKMKENKKRDKYLDLARELKKSYRTLR